MESIYKKYHSRLAAEGALKSLVFAVIAGFSVNLIVAFVMWFVQRSYGVWLAVGLGLGVVAICAPALYFVKFKPTAYSIARRLDRLGLQERIITMRELQNDPSYIAKLQREDAIAHVNNVASGSIKIGVSMRSAIIAGAVALFAIVMTIISGLSYNGLIMSGKALAGAESEKEKFYEVSYVAEEGGYIEGEEEQLVAFGESSGAVIAVAEDGWVFVGWDDGKADPSRFDENIKANLIVMAVFEQLGDDENGEPNNQDGPPQGDKDGPPSENDNGGEDGPPPMDPSGAGGGHKDSNDIFKDGETHYGEEYDYYYQMAMQYIAEGKEIPESLRAGMNNYFGTLL